MGSYGDFIHDLDHSVGEIMDALAYSGVLENTIVIFTSDNGGDFCPEEQQAHERGFQNNGVFRGDKHTIWKEDLKCHISCVGRIKFLQVQVPMPWSAC